MSGTRIWVFLLFVGAMLLVGCGQDTTLHAISGQVTLAGVPRERLLVYFRPIGKLVNEYNLGVGETDKTGRLTLRSTAGDGLVKGKYRVTFSYGLTKINGREIALPTDRKEESTTVVSVEQVPEKFTDSDQSPVEFEVVAGSENRLEFDIPGM